MGLFNFALVLINAEIHYYLANPERKTMPNHRYTFHDNMVPEDLLVTPSDETTEDCPTLPTVANA